MRFYELLKKQFVLLRVSGIPVRADSRWVFVILILAFAIAAGIAPLVRNGVAAFVFGLITILIFFASIFVHEFAHAFVALREKLRVVEIVLHPFGGFTRFHREPQTPRSEFRIAAAGPVASLALAVLFAIPAFMAATAGIDVLAVLLGTLAAGNLLLAVFNMLPGYPLDGGRVLRAYLWHNGRDPHEATILTGQFGRAIGVMLIVFGVLFALLRGDLFAGAWSVIVGVFLYDAALTLIAEIRQAALISAGDVMMLPIAVSPDSTVQEFIDNVLPMYQQAAFPVSADRQLYGILMLKDIRAHPRELWTRTLIREIMKPVTTELFVDMDTPWPKAAEKIASNGVGAVGVVDTVGHLVGFMIGGRHR